MKTIHLESQRVGRKVETEMRRGKSIFEALAVAAMEARDRQERQKKTITGVWVDEMTDTVPNDQLNGPSGVAAKVSVEAPVGRGKD